MVVFQILLLLGGMIMPQYRIWTFCIDKLQSAQEEVTDPVAADQVQTLILMRNSSLFFSCAYIILTCSIFGFYCSHRLGGPIFKTIQYLREYAQGKKPKKLAFRKGDFFHELADEVNQLPQEKKS